MAAFGTAHGKTADAAVYVVPIVGPRVKVLYVAPDIAANIRVAVLAPRAVDAIQRVDTIQRVPHDKQVKGFAREYRIDKRQQPEMVWSFVDPPGLAVPAGVAAKESLDHPSRLSKDGVLVVSQREQRRPALRVIEERFQSGDELRFRRAGQVGMCIEEITRQRGSGAVAA